MTNKQLLKYFEKRPQANQLYLVGSVVFINEPIAEKYAEQVNLKLEIKHRSDVTAAAAAEKEDQGFIVLTKESAELLLLETELTKDTDYYDMKRMVVALEIQTKGKSKADYLKALINYKTEKANESGTDTATAAE